jgi:hypothetical protein
MKLNSAGVLAVVALVALAGCTGFAPGSTPGASPTDDAPETEEPTDTTEDAEAASDSGTVRFYISDEQNAIGDFEHLNVTISKIGFQTAGDADGDEEDPAETPENATDTPGENETGSPDENETESPPGNETESPEDNGTESPDENETEVPEDEEPDEEDEQDETDEADEEDEGDESEEAGESGEWVEYEVDDRAFDLTRLQGDNASLLGEFDVPEGAYSKVFVHVDEIDGTLENGDSVNVKLPSEKLQITQGFTVASNDSVDFVFDITVHKAGNSGKYILTPVISESGTDVPIEDVDEERNEDAEDEREEDSDQASDDGENEGESEEDESESDEEEEESDDEEQDGGSEEGADDEGDEDERTLDATFVGAVEPGANATLRISANDSAVANATVTVNDEVVGKTDGTGQLTFAVPEDAEGIEVEIVSGDAEVELEVEFEDAPPA